jgi:predicted small secreted protein
MRRTLGPLATLVMLALIVAGCSNASAGAGSSGESTAATAGAAGSGESTAATAGAAGSGTAHEKAVAFAECMRANGISAFPDPDASGELTIDGIANGSSVDTSSAAFKQAINACKDLEPPGFTGTKVTPQQRTARLHFAQCVRGNGVPDFPDPTPNGPLVDTNRIPSAATTGGMSILNAAMRKCRQYASAAGVQGSR